MNNSKVPSPIRETDYEAIETALLQSARGRWFLSEYSKRNRSSDTRMLLDAITRIEANILKPAEPAPENSLFRRDLIEMSEAISQTRKEIAAMRPADHDYSQFSAATEALDAIVEATEKATFDILESAEDIRETAWLMRENGVDSEACDRLDSRATDIYTACSFQNLTGQRTSKVIEVLGFLERRVLTMIDIWGLDNIAVRQTNAEKNRPDAHLLNGPARRGEGIDQAKADVVMLDNEARASSAAPDTDTGPFASSNPAQPPQAVPPQATTQPEAAPTATIAGEGSQFHNASAGAAAFSAPAPLVLDEMEETKKQVLFS